MMGTETSILNEVAKTGLASLEIRSPFTIPSGIVTTVPSVLARIAREVPEIGFLTTKTLSLMPREGYREPVLYEYYPGCFVNAVGLANPGAHEFVRVMRPLLPLHDKKPLVVSIMGGNAEEFLECAQVLDPIADAFELNLSCPHVKGAGQCVGTDPDGVRRIVQLLKRHTKKPVIPKLSPNLGDIGFMAKLCEEEGADALCLINTVGPGIACDTEGNPILSNVVGGLSGAGILPIGLKSVREAASQVKIPIIAEGGIRLPEDVAAYRAAGASLFGVGSALAGMTTPEISAYFRTLVLDAPTRKACPVVLPFSGTRTAYFKTKVVENTSIGPGLFKVTLENGSPCDSGQFFFLRLPGIGEKPFSPAQDVPPAYFVRTVGPFTRALERLRPGDPLYMRGPYGKGFPEPPAGVPLVLVAGGTGLAPIMMAAEKWKDRVARTFVGFSTDVTPEFRREITARMPGAHIVLDPPGSPGEVVRRLAKDVTQEKELYQASRVFICGPEAMMNATVEVLDTYVSRNRIFTAREDIMRCGIGVCGSCGTPSGLRSCVDGPVMHPG
jgi:dihydroorotate dehydrogenase (NAD+) catalytic subunit